MVSRVLLLVVYFFFFSVQLCLKYTSGSFDTDAFQCSFVTAKTHTAVQISAVFHPTDSKENDSILNKRFEPVTVCMPCQEFRFMPMVTFVPRTFYVRDEAGAGRSPVTVSLRGPPAIG
jgi:hypothetical protein